MTGTLRGLALSAAVLGLATTAEAADHTLRLHTLVASPHPYNDMAEYFKERVEQESGGSIEVQIFPQGTLGQDPAVIDELRLGTVDLMISSTNNAARQIPEYQVFSLPYLWADYEPFEQAVAHGSPVFEYMKQVYEDRGLGLKLLALAGSGARNLSNAARPVESLDDVQGLRMRIPPSPMLGQVWEALGTLPVTVAWGELYAAIQTGVAQALESSLSGYNGSKLFEVAPHLALTEHEIQTSHFTMSARSWERLPADLQSLVQEAATAAGELGTEKGKEADDTLVEELETEHGVTVTRPDKGPFIERVTPLHDEFAADMGAGAEELLAIIRSL